MDDMLYDLPDAMHRTDRLAAVLSGEARLRRMLDVEVALAHAEAELGLVGTDVAAEIERGAARVTPSIAQMSRDGALGGIFTLPVVAALREAVTDEAAKVVHLGATSQDVIDTATVLQLRDALAVISEDLQGAGDAAARLAQTHRDTPMAGRTLLQQAVPVTFGLKAAGWLGGLTTLRGALAAERDRLAVLQFGGAAGTLASFGERGIELSERLAARLELALPPQPWHSDRTRIGLLAGWLGTASGQLSKIANDVILLMQHEVGEAAEAQDAGKGRSSAMPHKRNPVETLSVRIAGELARGRVTTLFAAMEQEHERAVGGWQTEWTALPDAVHLVGGQVARTRSTLERLTVDTERMRRNLDATLGLPLAEGLSSALTTVIGAPSAYRLVSELTEQAAGTGRHLREVAAEDARVLEVLRPEQVDAALAPEGWLGSAGAFVDRAVAAWNTPNA